MYLERLLQINLATLAALGALLLGMGQRSELPPLLVALSAVLSVWLTDVTGRFHIKKQVANVLMLLAGAISLYELFPLHSEVQAFGLAWLLICIQIIVLFQRKDERLYWLLVMLSLLQVVVATLFSQGVWFGFLLTAYMMLGFSAMTLLLLFRQWSQGAGDGIQGPGFRAQGSGSNSEVASQPDGVAHATPEPRTLNPEPPRRWPLAARRAEFASFPSGNERAGLGRDLFRRLSRAGGYTLALTAVLFFALPRSRLGQTDWCGSLSQPQTLVGFTDKVNLGEMGEIGDSPERVMRVWFSDYFTKKPVPVSGEIYLNGVYLLDYQNGQWHTAGPPSTNNGQFGFQQLQREPLPASGLVEQTIRLEAVTGQELFYVSPFISLGSNYEVQRDCGLEKLLRVEERPPTRYFQYALGTTAIVAGRQRGLSPTRNYTQFQPPARQLPENKNGVDPLRNLKALARRWIAESGLPEKDRLGRARWLEQKFLASGTFTYSLVGQQRDTTIDPIEDFVTQHPQGHCEYFATALTLMLRSLGIPARVVSGFKCDEWNAGGGYYQVRQRHAHTWVEAYIRAGQIPPELMHGKDRWPWNDGAWIRLDPTPGGGEGLRTHWYSPIGEALDWVDSKWSNYVVELDFDRQRDAIYQPIAAVILAGWREATDPGRWNSVLGSVGMANYLDHLSREVRWLMAVGAAVVLAVLLVAVVWLLVRVVRRLRGRRLRGPHRHARGRPIEVGFYRRLETLLARQGLVRAAAQTQREFAAAAGGQLAARTGQAGLAGLPPLVAEAFYCVRFGLAPLDKIQAQAVEHALAEIAACRRQGGG